MAMRKYVLPVVAGVMSGMMLLRVGERAIHAANPPAAGLNLENKAELEQYIAALPSSAFVMMTALYIFCTALAGTIARLVSGGSNRAPLVAGIFITLAAVLNVAMIPVQPLWFSVVSIIVVIPAALAGARLVSMFTRRS